MSVKHHTMIALPQSRQGGCGLKPLFPNGLPDPPPLVPLLTLASFAEFQGLQTPNFGELIVWSK